MSNQPLQPSTIVPTGKGKVLLEYIVVLFAGVLYAVALKYFVLPTKVVLTGTEGIAAALSYYFESDRLFIILYFIFQVILIAFAFFAVSRSFALRSFLVVGTVVVFLWILPELRVADPDPNNERMILVIFGGLLAGVAKAMAFRNRGSTGDEDILGAYFAMKYLKPVGYIAIIAATISTTFGLILDYLKNGHLEVVVNTLMYTCIYIFISAETLNNLYRKFKLTMLSVITKDHEKIGGVVKSVFSHRTYTYQPVSGGHSKGEFWLVRTIITHEELPLVKETIQATDPHVFFYHHDIDGISQQYFISPIR
tara:strand:+ start:11669 stop:12595 length:927 start_codon:yes stop_codon:yes gene_type:complete